MATKKRVPRDPDPQELHGSPDAGIAREWPEHTYQDESSALDNASESGNAGRKSREPGGDL